MNPEALIEAVLFSSENPVALKSLLSSTGLSEKDALEAIENLKSRYHPGSSGVILRFVSGGYLLSTNPECSAAVENFRREAPPSPLSAASYEVLSCALYFGPLTRRDVSSIRGVNSDAVVRSLIERNLLTESGASDSPGSPALLEVTGDFLVAAGAASRRDFSPLDSLVSEEEISRIQQRVSGENPS